MRHVRRHQRFQPVDEHLQQPRAAVLRRIQRMHRQAGRRAGGQQFDQRTVVQRVGDVVRIERFGERLFLRSKGSEAKPGAARGLAAGGPDGGPEGL